MSEPSFSPLAVAGLDGILPIPQRASFHGATCLSMLFQCVETSSVRRIVGNHNRLTDNHRKECPRVWGETKRRIDVASTASRPRSKRV